MKKILIAGDAEGNFSFLFEKIKKLLKKGQKFDFLICLGSSLSLSMDLAKIGEIPIKTYFIDSSEVSQGLGNYYPEGLEIIQNLFFLGRAGIKTIEGISIGYLNGVQNLKISHLEEDNIKFSGVFYNQKDLKKILTDFEEFEKNDLTKGIDIFISNEWPQGFEKYADFSNKEINNTSKFVTEIVNKLNPRYHFVALEDYFYQRPPYINQKNYTTRLISLAKLTNTSQKYLFAIEINAIHEMSKEKLFTENCEGTMNPYQNSSFSNNKENIVENSEEKKDENEENTKEELTENVELYVSNFNKYTKDDEIKEFLSRWGKLEKLDIYHEGKFVKFALVLFTSLEITKITVLESGKYSLNGRRIYFKVNKKKEEKNCWFCLKSPNADKSLIVFIGKKYYVALDKGPILERHLLIIPIEHNYSLFDENDEELNNLKEIIRKIFFNNYQESCLFFERFMKIRGNFMHGFLQCIPLNIDKLDFYINNLENSLNYSGFEFYKFKEEEKQKLSFFRKKNEFYLLFQIFDKDFKKITYLHLFNDEKNNKQISQSFGREIACKTVDVKRVNWKECVFENEKQQKILLEIQNHFKKFFN